MRTHCFILLFLLSSSVVAQDTLRTIESTRSGQHWADAETDPPKSAEDSLKCFQVEPGLKVELVAAEPLIFDPVAIAFDRRGRMFAAEYRDYPTGPEKKSDPPLSRIVMLEDSDGDGRMDRRTVFADHLNFVHSLMPWNDGILVAPQDEILFLKDTDGDNIADLKQVLYRGFKPFHSQAQIGNPRWGIDNWITLNYGPGNVSSSEQPEKVVTMPRLDFRFHPLTRQFEPDSGLGQYGNTVDRWGNRFFCANRNPIMTTLMPYRAVKRNPFLVIPKAYVDVAPSGGETRVFPLVEMKSNWLSHAGTHTSACGVTAYLGDLFGSDFSESVFVCEPVGYLVTRSLILREGIGFTSRRARPRADFLASTDTWFRPASLATGPNGAIYVADMYRLYVEHPRFFPEEAAKKMNWRAGEDRGRIWRIVPEKGGLTKSFKPPESTDDLLNLLCDQNGWRQFLAQRLLVERQEKQAVPGLNRLLGESESATTRLHAMWTLDGLHSLQVDQLLKLLHDENIYVQRDAVRLASYRLNQHHELLDQLLLLVDDENQVIRYQTALALGEADQQSENEQRILNALVKLAVRDGAEKWFALAILTCAEKRSALIFSRIAHKVQPTHKLLIRELATVAGTRGDLDEISLLLKTVGDASEQGVWWQTVALSGLAGGLQRYRGELGRLSLAKLLSKPPKELKDRIEPIRKIFAHATDVALDNNVSINDRVAAIELVGYQPFTQAEPTYRQLLTAEQPVEIQIACVQTMQKSGNAGIPEVIFESWSELGPQVRQPALDLLLRRIKSTKQVLVAMKQGRISPAVIDLDRRVRLLKHQDETIKKLAEELFGGAVSADRQEVARKYSAALTMQASAKRGVEVFDRSCAKCHRVDGRGYEVGPDISDVRNRSTEAILYDILDPNRAIDPKYTDYIVLTEDGQTFTGLISAETTAAVILRQAENKQQTIARNKIEEMRASGRSLMPEGLEKELTVQQMADLLKYLKAANRSEISASAKEIGNP